MSCDYPSTAKEDCNAHSGDKGTGSEKVNVEINIQEISNQVLEFLRKHLQTNKQLPVDCDLQQLAHDVLSKVAAQSSDGTAELLSKDSVGRTMKRSFVAVPTRRKRLDPTSSPKQQSNFVCEKAKVIGAFVGSHLRADTPHERHIGRRVLNKIAEQFGGTVHNIGYKFKTLDMQEVITLRDIGPKTSSAMVRFVSAFCALRPDLESELGIQIWPKCLQARLTLFESTNNFELKSMKCNVQVKKDDTLYKMRPTGANG